MELYFHSTNTPSWRGVQLKAQGQIYLTFTILKYKFFSLDNFEVVYLNLRSKNPAQKPCQADLLSSAD
jgi:hypothetical protein